MASLKDISKICGVSVATVSKALNDHKDIGEETKANIRRVAKEMGYSPNLSARRAVTTLHLLTAARTVRIGCPTWNTAGTEALMEWCSPVLISQIRKSSN